MDKIVIQGGIPLKGEVKISGSKNAALPIITSCLLTDEVNIYRRVPHLADIQTLTKLLNYMGVKTQFDHHRLVARGHTIKKLDAPYHLVRTMRASVLVLGPLITRFGDAKVSLPGGCAIGARPINLHLMALEKMGAHITLEQGYVHAKAKRLKGASILFPQVTVTGTANVLMAATLAKGTTIIENAALEPEIDDLIDILIKMGAKIEGRGTSKLIIDGVDKLQGADHSIMGDRIEAGTFLIAAAMTKGHVTIKGIDPKILKTLLDHLKKAGAKIETGLDYIHIIGPKTIRPVSVETQPHPGFATDFQAQFMAMMSLAKGQCEITENIFENRFMHIAELNRMGADIDIQGNTAKIKGVSKFLGAPVMATDLRASACLVLAGLACKSITEIHRVYHIDRGYEFIEQKFRRLGAKIKRAKVKY